ncbi:MAG: PAS domain-containing protein [Deltaproteobacteria bacterium]|nr:PAS domain-containing protein [Deltaproteobacteria bacterium]
MRAARQAREDESLRPPAVLALLAVAGPLALLLLELFPLPHPEVHRGVAILIAVLSLGTAAGLLARWHRQGVRRPQVTRPPGAGEEVQVAAGVQRDVAEERRREEALRAAQAQIELLTSRTPAGIFQCDAAERLVYLNEMLCALTGLPPERLLAGGWLAAVLPADRRRVVASWRAAMEADEPFRGEFRIGVDGTPAWVHAVAMPLRDDEGRRTGVVGVMTDVTEARRLKEQLGKAERMASLGTLAAGMAHEVNNPLAAVRSGLAFAAREVAGRAELRDTAEALADAAAGAERVARIVRELQAFAEARDQAGSLEVGAVAREAWEALPAPLRERGRFQVEAHAAPRATASRSQLRRVLGHLLQNAIQSLPAPGAGSVAVRVRAAGEGRIAVEVVDDGSGIPAELLPRVFDPFYTTREVGQGTGLGLAVCHALVQVMGGEIELSSERGRGTTARLLLPSAAEPTSASTPAPARPTLPGAPARPPPPSEWLRP